MLTGCLMIPGLLHWLDRLVVFEVDRGKSADLFQRNGWASAEIREPGQIGASFDRIRSLPKQWAGAEISNLRRYLVRGNNPP